MKTQEYNPQDEQIIQMLTPNIEVKPSADLKARILKAAAEQNKAAEQTAKPRKSRLNYWLGAATSMAAVVAIAITMMLNTPAYAARRYFTNAILAANEVKSMVMKLKVRTRADESIEYINPECDFVAATIKAIYDDPILWSVEKQGGRRLLYKGEVEGKNLIYQWIDKPDGGIGWASDYYGIDNDLAPFINPRQLLNLERKAAESKKGTRYEIVDNGITVNVRAITMAQGNYSENDYMLNTSLAEANTIREYTFDRASGRLTKLRIDMVISSELQITVIDSESIVYDEPLTADNLTDKELDKVKFSSLEPTIEKNSPLQGISAHKAAKIILQAMNEWDTDILNTAMYYYRNLFDKLKSKYGGLKVISIGKPFKSGLYPGYFVKCKVELSSGEEDELILALRNDNKEKVWLLDGGL